MQMTQEERDPASEGSQEINFKASDSDWVESEPLFPPKQQSQIRNLLLSWTGGFGQDHKTRRSLKAWLFMSQPSANTRLTPSQTEEASQDLQTRHPQGQLTHSRWEARIQSITPHGTNPPPLLPAFGSRKVGLSPLWFYLQEQTQVKNGFCAHFLYSSRGCKLLLWNLNEIIQEKYLICCRH